MEDKSRRKIIYSDNTNGLIRLSVEEDCWKVVALGLMQSGYMVGMKGCTNSNFILFHLSIC